MKKVAVVAAATSVKVTYSIYIYIYSIYSINRIMFECNREDRKFINI